jgi:hypothetical protein
MGAGLQKKDIRTVTGRKPIVYRHALKVISPFSMLT